MGRVGSDAIGRAAVFPTSAAQVATFAGFGTFSGATANAGYLCNDASGGLVAAYGSPNMTQVGSPTYHVNGPGRDLAVSFGADSNSNAFSAGNNFNVGASDDFIRIVVCRLRSLPGGTRYGAGKFGTGAYYQLFNDGSAYQAAMVVSDGAFSASPLMNNCFTIGGWNVLVHGIDRGASTNGTVFIGTDIAATSSPASGVLGALTSALNFTDQGAGGNIGAPVDIAFEAISVGAGVAASCAANALTLCRNFRRAAGF